MLRGAGSRGTCGSPPTDGKKKQVGVRGRGAQRGWLCKDLGCGWLWDVMNLNLLSREEDERALRDQWDCNIITRHHQGEEGLRLIRG